MYGYSGEQDVQITVEIPIAHVGEETVRYVEDVAVRVEWNSSLQRLEATILGVWTADGKCWARLDPEIQWALSQYVSINNGVFQDHIRREWIDAGHYHPEAV